MNNHPLVIRGYRFALLCAVLILSSFGIAYASGEDLPNVPMHQKVKSSIKFDNAALIQAYGLPVPVTYKVGKGKNRVLVVCEYTLNDTALPPLFAGQPMSFIGKSTYHGVGNLGVAAFAMINPPSGAHSLELRTSAGLVSGFVASYKGVDHVHPVDAFNTHDAYGTATDTDSITTATPGDWLVMCTTDTQVLHAGVTASGTVRAIEPNNVDGVLQDSNGGISAGTHTMSVTNNAGPSTYITDLIVALKAVRH